MPQIFRNVASVALTLSLAIWVGALAGFAFLYAPATFHAMGPTTAFAALIASLIEELSFLGHACAIVAIAAALVLALRPAARARSLTIAAIVLVMGLLVLVQVSWVLPQMRATVLQTPAYASLHRRSSMVYGSVLLLGVIGVALSALRRDP